MKGGMPYADAALARRDAFVQVCLLAQRQDGNAGPPDAEQSLKVSFVQQLTACPTHLGCWFRLCLMPLETLLHAGIPLIDVGCCCCESQPEAI